MDLQELAAAVSKPHEDRIIVGIAGPPGGGKTTLARALCEATGFSHAPGDGFILTESFTDSDGSFRERGSVSGFDTDAYAALLHDLHSLHRLVDVSVPNYRHTHDGAGADSWVVPAAAAGVVTECNFLGSTTHGWPDVRARLTHLVFVEESWDVCRPRLLERQLAKGRTQAEAEARVDSHDRANYDEAIRAASTADFVVHGDSILA